MKLTKFICGPNDTQTYSALLLGKAGELRVASELLLRGFRPCLNLIDTGADMILENGVSIQVKSARLTKPRGQNSSAGASRCYRFQCRHWKGGKPHGLKGVDYLVLWGVDTDEFWIVAINEIRELTTISIYPTAFGSRSGKRNFRSVFNRKACLGRWEILAHKPMAAPSTRGA